MLFMLVASAIRLSLARRKDHVTLLSMASTTMPRPLLLGSTYLRTRQLDSSSSNCLLLLQRAPRCLRLLLEQLLTSPQRNHPPAQVVFPQTTNEPTGSPTTAHRIAPLQDLLPAQAMYSRSNSSRPTTLLPPLPSWPGRTDL